LKVENTSTFWPVRRPQLRSQRPRHERGIDRAYRARRRRGTPFKNLVWRALGVRIDRKVFDGGAVIPERTLTTGAARHRAEIFPDPNPRFCKDLVHFVVGKDSYCPHA
jgi:hypothetical protein